MKYLLHILTALITTSGFAYAQSTLLESVKRNPNEALEQCKKFKYLNSQNLSASSKNSINKISQQRNISSIDAEILSMYIRGLYCPEVF